MKSFKAEDFETVLEGPSIDLTRTTVIKGKLIKKKQDLSADIRIYYLQDGVECPSKSGLRIPVAKIKELKKLLTSLTIEIDRLTKTNKEDVGYVQPELFK